MSPACLLLSSLPHLPPTTPTAANVYCLHWNFCFNFSKIFSLLLQHGKHFIFALQFTTWSCIYSTVVLLYELTICKLFPHFQHTTEDNKTKQIFPQTKFSHLATVWYLQKIRKQFCVFSFNLRHWCGEKIFLFSCQWPNAS